MSIFHTLTNLPDTKSDEQSVDCAKRYDGTIMLLSNEKYDNLPVSIKVRGTIIRCLTLSAEIQVDGTKEKATLVPFMPAVGYYNIDGHCAFLIKQPQRQWKRSFCPSIYRIKAQNNNMRTGIPDSYLAMAQGILDNNYLSLDQITHPLITNLALNRMFAITGHKGNSFLTYRGCSVGILNFKTMEIELQHSILEQEIKDLLKRTGVTKWKLKTT